MLERARAAGVKSMIITGGSLKESREALKLAEKHGNEFHISYSVPSDLAGLM